MTDTPKRLRLLHMIVQPVFVVDDGDLLPIENVLPPQPDGSPSVVQPVFVAAADWPTYATAGYVKAFDNLQEQINTPSPVEGEPSHLSPALR